MENNNETENLYWLIDRKRKDLENFEGEFIQLNAFNGLILTIIFSLYLIKDITLLEKIGITIIGSLIIIQLLFYIYLSFPLKITEEIKPASSTQELEKYFSCLKKIIKQKALILLFCLVLFTLEIGIIFILILLKIYL